jgi:regulatory protein
VIRTLAEQIAAIERSPGEFGGVGGADAPLSPLPEGGATAMGFLIRSTNQRPLTEGEARDKLAAREHPPEVIDAVIEQAVAGKLLDDRAFAEGWVNDRGVNRGYGRDRLRRELRKRKIPDPLIDQALVVLEDHDETAQATALARKRAQGMPATLEPPKVAQRLVGFLVRRGFPSHVAHDVARKVTAMDRDWD